MRVLFVCLVFLCLGGCQFLGTILNGTQRVYAIVADDRTTSDDLSDIQINAAVRNALGEKSGALMIDIEVTVFEGTVLLTGTVPRPDILTDIMTATWSVSGVRKVYNYVRVCETPSPVEVAAEAAIASRIKTQLGLTAGIESSNYKLTLEGGTVYLMGVCTNDEEYDKVQAIIKSTDGVDKIIYLMRRPIED